MLHEFLQTNHDELVKRCRAKVAERPAPAATDVEPEHGVSVLLGQLVHALRAREAQEPLVVPASIGGSAEKHGRELLLQGLTVDQVVHDYGDLCQAVTELAAETTTPITVDEFRTFNRCLDDAIADAVTEFGRQRDQGISAAGTQTLNERLGSLAHEIRNHLNTAMLAFEALRRGNATVGGATGMVLGRSLAGLRELIDRSLADVRLSDGLQVRRETIAVCDLFDDLRISAALEADTRGVVLMIAPVDGALRADADRQMISAALSNLLQNAFKFTRHGGHVSLTARTAADRVLIEVADECGGLPPGKSEELFAPFSQRGVDRSGVGLGLSISRRAVEANGGVLSVRNLEGKGCIFCIDLARASKHASRAQAASNLLGSPP